jgi:hypothetical protein
MKHSKFKTKKQRNNKKHSSDHNKGPKAKEQKGRNGRDLGIYLRPPVLCKDVDGQVIDVTKPHAMAVGMSVPDSGKKAFYFNSYLLGGPSKEVIGKDGKVVPSLTASSNLCRLMLNV